MIVGRQLWLVSRAEDTEVLAAVMRDQECAWFAQIFRIVDDDGATELALITLTEQRDLAAPIKQLAQARVDHIVMGARLEELRVDGLIDRHDIAHRATQAAMRVTQSLRIGLRSVEVAAASSLGQCPLYGFVVTSDAPEACAQVLRLGMTSRQGRTTARWHCAVLAVRGGCGAFTYTLRAFPA